METLSNLRILLAMPPILSLSPARRYKEPETSADFLRFGFDVLILLLDLCRPALLLLDP